MIVMSLEKVPPSLRGRLTRWLFEIRANVFVGTVSARIRDELWNRAVERSAGGAILQIWSESSEQGFGVRSWGEPSYTPRDREGLIVIERPLARQRHQDNARATKSTTKSRGA